LTASIALEAIQGQRTINDIAGHSGVPPNQVRHWKTQARAELPQVFSARRTRISQDEATLNAHLYQQLGPLKGALDGRQNTAGLLRCRQA
jgi:transposase-like protein